MSVYIEFTYRVPKFNPNFETSTLETSFEELLKKEPGAELISQEYPKYAWPGGYPLFYLCQDGGCLCPDCANENFTLTQGDDPQWKIIDQAVNWEEEDLACDNCYKKIEAAYDDS